MRELNEIVLGKELFASIKGQLCLAKGKGFWVIKKGMWRSNIPLIRSCF